MAAGLAISLIVLGVAIAVAPRSLLPEQGALPAIVHALSWDILLVAWLVAGVGMLARHRFFSPADIDGGGLSEGTAVAKMLQSILQNTLEQTVLALATHLIWAAVMPAHWQAAVPAAAMLFFIGRFLFWRGYASGAPARALGFTLSFYPTAVMLILIAGRIVGSWFAA